MKVKLAVLLALCLMLLGGVAAADEPWTYPAQKCSGLSHSNLMFLLQDYTTQFGWDHQLGSDLNVWQANHAKIVNGFLASVGCPPALNEDSTELTFWYKLYVPTYSKLIGRE